MDETHRVPILPMLTRGVVARAMDENGQNVVYPSKVLIQILGIKRLFGRFGYIHRFLISDGELTHRHTLLAANLNHLMLASANPIKPLTVIRVGKMIAYEKNNKKVIEIISATVETQGGSVCQKLGNPKPCNSQVVSGVRYKSCCIYSSSSIRTTSIEHLSATSCKNIAIRVRVISKEIKPWSNLRGSGTVFLMNLVDESGVIQMAGFNDLVDDFYDLIQVNKIYYICYFVVRYANKKYSNANYDLRFTPDTKIMLYLEEENSVYSTMPSLSFNFVNIDQITNSLSGAIIDVIGVCKRVTDAVPMAARSTGKDLVKRELTLIEKSGKEINLTLWGKQALDFNDVTTHPIVAVKFAKVSDFNGCSLSTISSSILKINPDHPTATVLRDWYNNEGFLLDVNLDCQSMYKPMSAGVGAIPWKLVAEANTDCKIVNSVNTMETAHLFLAKVTLMDIGSNPVYAACSNDKCCTKVFPQGNGTTFRCYKCSSVSPNFKLRLNLQVNFGDISGNFWTSCFAEKAEIILGKKSEVLLNLFEQNKKAFDELVNEAKLQQYIGKFLVKSDIFNSEIRKRIEVVKLTKISHAEYSKHLLAEIHETRS